MAGRPAENGPYAAFSGNFRDGALRTYAAGVSYYGAGRVREKRFRTQTPLYYKRAYNVRSQLYDVRLSNVPRAWIRWTGAAGAPQLLRPVDARRQRH